MFFPPSYPSRSGQGKRRGTSGSSSRCGGGGGGAGGRRGGCVGHSRGGQTRCLLGLPGAGMPGFGGWLAERGTGLLQSRGSTDGDRCQMWRAGRRGGLAGLRVVAPGAVLTHESAGLKGPTRITRVGGLERRGAWLRDAAAAAAAGIPLDSLSRHWRCSSDGT